MKHIIKHILLVLLISVSAMPAFAQIQTLLDREFEIGSFAAPVAKFTLFDDEFGIIAGGRGGWVFDRTIGIGAGGYFLVNDVPSGVNDLDLDIRYGGLEVEFIGDSDRLVHYSFMTLIGAGRVGFRNGNGNERDTFFIAEPSADVTLNVTNFLRVALGAGYRFTLDVDAPGLDNESLNGPTVTLTFKIGSF